MKNALVQNIIAIAIATIPLIIILIVFVPEFREALSSIPAWTGALIGSSMTVVGAFIVTKKQSEIKLKTDQIKMAYYLLHKIEQHASYIRHYVYFIYQTKHLINNLESDEYIENGYNLVIKFCNDGHKITYIENIDYEISILDMTTISTFKEYIHRSIFLEKIFEKPDLIPLNPKNSQSSISKIEELETFISSLCDSIMISHKKILQSYCQSAEPLLDPRTQGLADWEQHLEEFENEFADIQPKQ